MSQLAGGGSQPKYGEELDCLLRRLETVRFQADGWQEPYESRGSRTVAWGTGGEIPPVYPTVSSFAQPTESGMVCVWNLDWSPPISEVNCPPQSEPVRSLMEI